MQGKADLSSCSMAWYPTEACPIWYEAAVQGPGEQKEPLTPPRQTLLLKSACKNQSIWSKCFLFKAPLPKGITVHARFCAGSRGLSRNIISEQAAFPICLELLLVVLTAVLHVKLAE